MDVERIFAVLFAPWSGRRAPVASGRLWPLVYDEAGKGGSPSALAYRLRLRGAWDAAALLEDEGLWQEAGEETERRGRRGWLPAVAVLPRMCEKLCASAPPMFWARGDRAGLRLPVIGVVGSRTLSPAEEEFAFAAGAEAAKLGFGVVSGGARGADRLGAEGAVSAGGFAAHILPGGAAYGLPRASALLCRNPDGPEFDRLEALARNRWVYASAEAVVLVSSRLEAGGSWMGAISARRSRLSPIVVFMPHNPSSGNEALSKLGARAVTSVPELAAALRGLGTRDATLAL